MEFLLLDHPWRFWLAAASFTLLGASYLVTSVVRMRVLAIGAFTLGALSLALDSEHPLWLEVVGLLGLAAINGLQWVRQKKKASAVQLSAQERALRAWLFPNLGDNEFQQLLHVSKRSFPVAGTFLVTQGEQLEQLYVIIQGTAHVVTNGMVVATLRDGNLVGEVSFFRDDVATASVVAQTDLSVLSIERAQLRKLMRQSEALQRALHESIGRDLGFKLTSFEASRF